MRLSITKVREQLPEGREFTGEFIGLNAKFCRPGMQVTRRRVVKNSSYQLLSRFLDGPQKGRLIYLAWKGLTAEDVDGAVILTKTVDGEPEAFLKITF